MINLISDMGIFSRMRWFAIGLGYCIIWGILYLIMGLQGWKGELGGCTFTEPCFCEEIVMDALIREKSQTMSNLGLIFSGLGILLWIEYPPKNLPTGTIQNPMVHPTLYSVLYGLLTINIGIGSFWFHGSLLRYAEFMDTFAMNLYIVFFLYYNLVRLTSKSEKIFLFFFIPTIVAIGIIEWFLNSGSISVWIFSTFAGLAITWELINQIRMHRSKNHLNQIYRDWRWFIAGVGSFLFSFLIWNLSLPGSILCNPHTWIQGHSFWHVGVAASTFLLYLYARSEKTH